MPDVESAWPAVGRPARRVPDRPTTRSEEARIIPKTPLADGGHGHQRALRHT